MAGSQQLNTRRKRKASIYVCKVHCAEVRLPGMVVATSRAGVIEVTEGR
jgi:hypothetical protein